MKARKKYVKQWEKFAEILKTGIRPRSFDEAWELIPDKHDYDKKVPQNKREKLSGFYHCEAKAIWQTLSDEEAHISQLVEIGRYFGASLFLWSCACRYVESVSSYDIEAYEITDDVFGEWFSFNNIKSIISVQDSQKLVLPDKTMVDFVMIDGEHTGPGVKADIEVWENKTRIISFHDFADQGRISAHKAIYPDVIEEIKKAKDKYGWVEIFPRGRSDITFKTRNYGRRQIVTKEESNLKYYNKTKG